MHVSDLDPSRPGLEVFSIQEPVGDAGVNFFDARTGEVLWKRPSVPRSTGKAEGPGRGLALDIDPRTPGAECWAAGAGLGNILWDAKGHVIGDKTPTCNMGVFWDGDPQREILSGTLVEKWDYLNARSTPLLEAGDFEGASNNGTKANPCLSADLLGDWREEIIWRTKDNKELRLFTSSLPTAYRLPTLMSDPQYRLSIAWQNVAYNQPPHLSYDLQSRLAKPAKTATVAGVAR